MSLTVRHLTDHVKRIKLQPLCKVADSILGSKVSLRLVQENLSRPVDKRFVLNE